MLPSGGTMRLPIIEPHWESAVARKV